MSLKKKRLFIFYDNEVEGHYPPHFKTVYESLLRDDLCVSIAAMTNGKISSSEAYEALWHKKSPKSFIKRAVYSWRRIREVRAFCKSNEAFIGADYVLVHNDPVVLLICKLVAHKKKYIYRLTHLKYEEVAFQAGFSTRVLCSIAILLRSRCIRMSDRVVAMSDAMKDYLAVRSLQSPSKFVSVPSMVDTSIVPPDLDVCSLATCEIQVEMKNKNRAFWLVYVGNIDKSRELGLLLEIMTELEGREAEKYGLLLLGVGDHSQLRLIRARIEETGLGNAVIVRSNVDEAKMLALIKLCDIGLSPYPVDSNPVFSYNSPIKLSNYLQCGIPVVGAALPDQKEVLANSKVSLSIGGTVQEYVEAITEVASKEIKDLDADTYAMKNWVNENRSIEVAAEAIKRIVVTL